jgi:hypothetical protein
MKNKILKYISLITVLIPSVSFAALDGVRGLLTEFGGLLNDVLRIVFALGLIFFFWGVGQFILHSGEEKTRTEGRNKMIWGIVAIFVMLSIYGIINAISGLIGVPLDPALISG